MSRVRGERVSGAETIRLRTRVRGQSATEMAWALVALLGLGVVFAGWRGGPVAIVAGGALVLGWMAAAFVTVADPRNSGGFIDCWPRCTAWQDTIGFAVFVVPALVVVLLLASLAGYAMRRVRR